jgi:hypothetical protein
LFWKAKVPPKVKVFGWKLATNSLGVQDHRCKRKMDIVPTCNICGVEPETAHHAMIECTKAKALRQRMRNDWDLPDENMFRYTGADWVLVLLNQLDDSTRAKLLLIWWRAWHMRNNALFGNGKCGIEQSSFFLQSYLTSFQDTREVEILTNPKGKHSVINLVPGMNLRRKEPEASWSKPDVGKAKLNFDASFLIENHSGSWSCSKE